MSTRRHVRAVVALLVALAAVEGARAQTSASHRLTEFTINNGGNPLNGSAAVSASHRIRLDAIGDPVTATALASASHRADVGFVSDYPPPGEVTGHRFSSKTMLTWSPEKSTGTYDVYRALVSSLPGLGYGACSQTGLAGESATDTATPPAGQGYFFLVTARNRLGEIGTKGRASTGIERANAAPCP